MKRAKISICIPTYNRADLLPATLNSVVKQTVRPSEVLVIDNASTDNTRQLVGRYKKFGIRYIRNRKNLGMAGNYNRCAELASNEYFTYLPSDDLIAPTWYEEWARLVARKKADLYTSPLTIIDNTYTPIWTFPLFSRSRLIRQPHVMREFAKRYSPGMPPSAASVYRKSIVSQIAPFDNEEGAECDVRPTMTLFDRCDIYYYHHYLFAFREHPVRSFITEKQTRASTISDKIDRYFSIVKDMYGKLYNYEDKSRYVIQTIVFMTLSNVNLYIARGEIGTIVRCYRSAKRHFPDILTRQDDWQMFAKIQLEYIRRVLRIKRISPHVKKQIQWIYDLKDEKEKKVYFNTISS